MKILFLLLSFICAGLSSALILRIAERPESEQPREESQPETTSFPSSSTVLYPEQTRAIEDLKAAIIARQEELDRKEESLKKLESDLHLRTALITRLQTELTDIKESMETEMAGLDEEELKNTQKLAEFYSKMEPGNAARLLTEIDPERAASLLTLLSDRQAGKIMDAAIAQGENGIERAVLWTKIIREMKQP